VKVKVVTKYESNDGKLFDSEADAVGHEEYLKQAKTVAGILPPRPDDGCKFDNGAGYIQHTPELVREYKRAVLLLAASKRPDVKFAEWAEKPDQVHGMSVVGRYIDDGCDKYIGRLWYRVCCLDDQCREWGQPYFALHPGRAENFKMAV
jgi:hypothetical protein